LNGRKGIRPVKNMGDGGGGHWLLVRMEWRPSGWSVCLPLSIYPCTIKSRSSLLAPAHRVVPEKGPLKPLWWLSWTCASSQTDQNCLVGWSAGSALMGLLTTQNRSYRTYKVRKVNHSGFYWSKRWWGGSGISWTICKSFAHHSRQISTPVPHHSVFTNQMPFLPPNRQH